MHHWEEEEEENERKSLFTLMWKSFRVLIFNDAVCLCRRVPLVCVLWPPPHLFMMMLLFSYIRPELWTGHLVSHKKPENYSSKPAG